MGVKEEVLRTLHEERGTYISGQTLADRLQVSRHAVWKAIDRLRADGYEIEARTNRGYCLIGEEGRFSADGVAALLAAEDGYRFEFYDTIDSTNNRARTLAEADAPAWTVVLANEQSAGRGRMGRSFYSPAGCGLYMSVVVRPHCDVADANLLTLAAAAAVAEAIEAVCNVAIGIKWVNDCFIGRKKVAGILTEASVGVEEQSLRYAIVGMGLNIAPPPQGYPPELEALITNIFEQVPDGAVHNRLAAEILRRFRPYAEALPARAYMDSYREHLFLIGRDVLALRGKTCEQVKVCALNDDGGLVVENASGQRRVLTSGEVSLRV